MEVVCSNKKMVQRLLECCYKYGIRHVVISPGSRNAPLTLSFTENQLFTCYSIPDERCAAFFALGLSKQHKQAVAVICTSGTAVLNFAPAIAEAYYQEIPLIAITADRPPEWIDQEDGQTIRQSNIYQNYIKASTNLPIQENVEALAEGTQKIEAILACATDTVKGPVQINIPFYEPLYETEKVEFKKLSLPASNLNLPLADFDNLVDAWNKSEKIMIIAGVIPPNPKLNSIIDNLIENKNALVLAPAYSNLSNAKIIQTPEILFNTITQEQKMALKPDLLISLGGPVVSKATKLFLREYKPRRHFDIDLNTTTINTYLSLTNKIISEHSKALNYVNQKGDIKTSEYFDTVFELMHQKQNQLEEILKEISFSDFAVFDAFFKNVAETLNLHLSNSTPIRYAELFKKHKLINYFCNRGTSGIDGNSSIALGAANASSEKTVLITGDIAFMYDSNAFWNNHVVNNFKIILINNGGGNIFRILKGPSSSKAISFFETPTSHSVHNICLAHNINYLSCSQASLLTNSISDLLKSDSCSVLEIFTNGETSADIYKNVFRELRTE